MQRKKEKGKRKKLKSYIAISFGVISAIFTFYILHFTFYALAATNISANVAEHWSWNDVVSWIDFYNTNTIMVSSVGLTGYASSSIGDISLDCATTRVGNICLSSNYRALNDGNGNLSGWGWNDVYGWISLCGGLGTADCPGANAYRTLVNGNTGDFSGWAWNDVVGWISFNCSDPGVCGSSNYKVKTSWTATSTSGFLDSSTFDTNISGGAAPQSIVWQGSLPLGTAVRFQLATSNVSGGPWTFVGPDGTVNSYYTAAPNVPITLDYTAHNNQRYFRYRVTLLSNQAQTLSPRVDRITVHWSP